MKITRHINQILTLILLVLIAYCVYSSVKKTDKKATAHTRRLFNYFFTYTISPTVKQCSKRKGIFFGVFVCSSVANFHKRKAIRKTWGRWLQDSEGLSLFFITGSPENNLTQQRLLQESREYSDIIQADFKDSYLNRTLKVISFLSWMNQFCPRMTFVMKIEDDVFLNVQILLHELRTIRKKNQNGRLFGHLLVQAKPSRNLKDKRYVPYHSYDQDVFPPFLDGHGYVMSGDVAKTLLWGAHAVPFFHLEDIYLTAFVANLLGIKKADHKGFELARRRPSGCSLLKSVTGNQVKPSEMHKIWNELNDETLKCSDDDAQA